MELELALSHIYTHTAYPTQTDKPRSSRATIIAKRSTCRSSHETVVAPALAAHPMAHVGCHWTWPTIIQDRVMGAVSPITCGDDYCIQCFSKFHRQSSNGIPLCQLTLCAAIITKHAMAVILGSHPAILPCPAPPPSILYPWQQLWFQSLSHLPFARAPASLIL
jgi:hypothetical protein